MIQHQQDHQQFCSVVDKEILAKKLENNWLQEDVSSKCNLEQSIGIDLRV